MEILDAEQIAREGSSSLKRQPEKKIRPGISGVRSTEGKITAAARRVGGGSIVPPEVYSESQRVRAVNPGDVVQDLVFVVTEVDGTECIRIESQIAADPQPREAREIT